jgi:hypothetical protein
VGGDAEHDDERAQVENGVGELADAVDGGAGAAPPLESHVER